MTTSEAVTEEKKAYATEWLPAHVRIIRRGDNFELWIQSDLGTKVTNIEIDETEADRLRFLWF